MKRSLSILAAASLILLSLTSCKTQYVRPTPPERCPAIPEESSRDADAWARLLGWFIDEYTRCAAKVDALHE